MQQDRKLEDRLGSGLGKGKILDTNVNNVHILSFNQTSEAERAGAIKRDTVVLAEMEGSGKHALAKIVEASLTKKQGQVKYYVTYSDQNRRLDRWVTSEQIISDL